MHAWITTDCDTVHSLSCIPIVQMSVYVKIHTNQIQEFFDYMFGCVNDINRSKPHKSSALLSFLRHTLNVHPFIRSSSSKRQSDMLTYRTRGHIFSSSCFYLSYRQSLIFIANTASPFLLYHFFCLRCIHLFLKWFFYHSQSGLTHF